MIYFLHIVLFSIVGWMHESFTCTFYHERQFRNRGLFLGPFCPIYGIGATICYFIFNKIDSWLLLILTSGAFCCIFEYFTGIFLEKVLHRKFWDYSKWILNIGGHTCFYCFLFFGTAVAVIVKILDPIFFAFVSEFDQQVLVATCIICFAIFAFDFIATFLYRVKLDDRFIYPYQESQDKINNLLRATSDKMISLAPAKIIRLTDTTRNNIFKSNQRLKSKEDEVHAWILKKKGG